MKSPKSTCAWCANPKSQFWNDKTNWEPGTVPAGKAVFESSDKCNLQFLPEKEERVESIEFAENADTFTFHFGTSKKPALTISGKGVTNRSGKPQNFVVAAIGESYKKPQLKFANKASAGGDDVNYAALPTSLQDGYAGGVIGFCDRSTAGSANFVVRTGALQPPPNSPVGAEVAFCDHSNAGTAKFTLYGTLGTDGDTFGNVVFHDNSSVDHAIFTNVGGTVPGGDGGNTQLYNHATAAHGVFNNYGGTVAKANGGDVAFDGNANAGYGRFNNYAAPVEGAYGGVTSFNNNPPDMKSVGASAGHGLYHNYGALKKGGGGGGHTEFTAKYGSSTADHGHFYNHGSAVESKSSAGHTVFEITMPTKYFPTAGNGMFWNQPAVNKQGAAGYTSFNIWGKGKPGKHVPTAGKGTFINMGAHVRGAYGGYTSFSNQTTAGDAKLVATGGTNGGYGGKISFYDQSNGGNASVHLSGNAELSISDHTGPLSIGSLEMTGGSIVTSLGKKVPELKLTKKLTLHTGVCEFYFFLAKDNSFALNKSYTILSAPNLGRFKVSQFKGNSINGVEPVFSIAGNTLKVTFKVTKKT